MGVGETRLAVRFATQPPGNTRRAFAMSTRSLTTGTPTRSQLNNSFGSDAADVGSSRNYPGTKSKAVDALIEIAGKAETRAELVTAIRALDRVLRARRDWIPNWFAATHKAAYWDMFGFKEPKPDYGFPVEAMWWFDEAKAKAIGRA